MPSHLPACKGLAAPGLVFFLSFSSLRLAYPRFSSKNIFSIHVLRTFFFLLVFFLSVIILVGFLFLTTLYFRKVIVSIFYRIERIFCFYLYRFYFICIINAMQVVYYIINVASIIISFINSSFVFSLKFTGTRKELMAEREERH